MYNNDYLSDCPSDCPSDYPSDYSSDCSSGSNEGDCVYDQMFFDLGFQKGFKEGYEAGIQDTIYHNQKRSFQLDANRISYNSYEDGYTYGNVKGYLVTYRFHRTCFQELESIFSRQWFLMILISKFGKHSLFDRNIINLINGYVGERNGISRSFQGGRF